MVEGKDDEHVLKHLCGNRNLPKLDEIKALGGVDELLKIFPVNLKGSDIEALGVVIDADTNLGARWQSLRDRLTKAGYGSVPEEPAGDGTIVEPPAGTLLPRVGIWLMPDNQTEGILDWSSSAI